MKTTQTIHCFLIDDDPEEIDIFHLALKELDITVKCTAFTDCNEALRNLIRHDDIPDCIFLDLYMGATSGKQCLKTIVDTEIIAQIPVVILSGSRNEPEIAELKKMGAQEFIVKCQTIEGLKDQLNIYFRTYFNLNEGLSI
jgi:CheY-like chemotaxis protein